MTEEFLVYFWKFNMKGQSYITTRGEEITIMHPGSRNDGAGPDFTNAMIRIGNTTWAGNVEIHLRSSDWHRHSHHDDEAYDSIILHVVFQHDMEILRKNGESIPVLCLEDLVGSSAYGSYLKFLSSGLWIPCAAEIGKVRSLVTSSWLDALAFERLQIRCKALEQMMVYSNHDWDQVFYQSLMAAFGFGVNKEPFEMLARHTPFRIVTRHIQDRSQLEALFFGQAGFLERSFHDSYPKMLREEYQHLKHKYTLSNLPSYLWKFLRLRPGNFPTIRLAQAAMLCHHHGNLHNEVNACSEIRQLRELLKVSASDYWNDHYLFDKKAKASVKQLEEKTADLLIINHIIPFMFFEGRSRSDALLEERAIQMLSSLPSESNLVTRRFRASGLVAGSASDSQGLLQLKQAYCDRKRCLECTIGSELVG